MKPGLRVLENTKEFQWYDFDETGKERLLIKSRRLYA